MPEASTLRWLVREEWSPLGGPTVVRFSAPSGSHMIPDDEWVDDLHGGSEVRHERIGIARMPAGRKTPEFGEFETFREWIEEEAVECAWEGEWARSGDEPMGASGLQLLFDSDPGELEGDG